MTSTLKRSVDWMFRSRETGEIVLGQAPNLAMAVASVSFAGAVIVKSDRVRLTWAKVAVIALTVWALQELFSGVNPFRRLGGAGTLVGIGLLARR